MKKLLIVLAALLPLSLFANGLLHSKSLDSYTITFPSTAEKEEGKSIAKLLAKSLEEASLPVPNIETDLKKGDLIAIKHSSKLRPWDYNVTATKSGLDIDCGGCWAMEYAVKKVVEALKEGDIEKGFALSGSLEKEQIFPKEDETTLRILDDNIWDYHKSNLPAKWIELGVDCRDKYRAPQFAWLVRAYMPDVVTFQEYNMDKELRPLLEQYGYKFAYEPDPKGDWNHTPIFYNTQTIDLVSSGYHKYEPEEYSNHGTKSYCYATFTQKATGKTFSVINTHLWWKSYKANPGSDWARTSQAALLLAKAEQLKREFEAPIFITGDMNCYEDSWTIQQYKKSNFKPCYTLATIRTNNENGHHVCSPNEGFDRKSARRSPERAKGAIDHCLVWAWKKPIEIRVFDCITAYFTVPLTDHYPNLIDSQLK